MNTQKITLLDFLGAALLGAVLGVMFAYGFLGGL